MPWAQAHETSAPQKARSDDELGRPTGAPSKLRVPIDSSTLLASSGDSTGATVEDTFRMTESFQQAQVESNEAVFSYEDGDEIVFMDSVEFDEIRVQKEDIASCDLLKDGMTVGIVKWGEVIVDINLPSSDTYEVTYTEPGLKKAASSGQSKAATLETGAEIQVPLFVEIGDVVKVKCAEREFIERAKK